MTAIFHRRRPPHRPTPPDGPDPAALLARIDQISQTARVNWFGLLAYLLFVGITLLGVEDADFFVDRDQTQLPLVNVSIPTFSFFWAAPLLGAALYAYFHLHLLKLWMALAAALRTIPAEDLRARAWPWLVNDLALRLATGTDNGRPLAWLSGFVTRLLVWVAGPAVIGYAWWRSMPAHEEWLTLFIALCLLVSLLAGFVGWWTLVSLLKRRDEEARPWQGWLFLKRPLAVVITLSIVALSWLRTEGGFDHYALVVMREHARFTETRFAPRLHEETSPAWRAAVAATVDRWSRFSDKDRQLIWVRNHPWIAGLDDLEPPKLPGGLEAYLKLAPADLRGVALVPEPADWLPHETARTRFRADWCRRNGLPAEMCGDHPFTPAPKAAVDAGEGPPAHLLRARDDWCLTAGYAAGEGEARAVDPAACAKALAGLESAFGREWTEARAAQRGALAEVALAGRDLRRADLVGAFFAGADLRGARMEGAVLIEARMEGADLRGARMEGADLRGARMEGADLSLARMEGAVLTGC